MNRGTLRVALVVFGVVVVALIAAWRMQQGRVLLDADWNEQLDIEEHVQGG